MKTKLISIEDTHEIRDFLNLISTGHEGCGVSLPCGASETFRRLNIIFTGKTRKGKTTKFKRGRKYDR